MASVLESNDVIDKQEEIGNNSFLTSLYGFMSTRLLISFHRLGIFEELLKHRTTKDIADRLNLNLESLNRSFEAASSLGILIRNQKGYSVPAAVSHYVDHRSEEFMGPILEHFANNTLPIFDFLEDAIKDGMPKWEKINHGEKDIDNHAFEKIFASNEDSSSFHDAMWNLSYKSSKDLIDKGLLSNAKTLVDLGGGTGSFAVLACLKNEKLLAKVFDLPEVETHFLRKTSNYYISDRLTFLPGDFWKSNFPSADCYALGYVLSNWNDHDSKKLLEKVRKSIVPGGKIIILERLLDEGRSGPFMAQMQDLAMLLETGGMHRTESHYRVLLESSGFKNISIVRSAYDKHAIIGHY